MEDDKKKAKNSSSLDLASIKHAFKPLSNLFRAHFSFIFTGAALLALVYAVLSVQLILQQTPTSDAATTSNEYSTKFDDATIKKVNDLGDHQDSGGIVLPQGRINPFSE